MCNHRDEYSTVQVTMGGVVRPVGPRAAERVTHLVCFVVMETRKIKAFCLI